MEKPLAGSLAIHVVKETLASVAKRGVPQIVSQPYRFDKIAVEAQRVAYIPCDARDQLDMQASTREIIVAPKAEHLRFAGVAVIGWQVQDLLGISDKGGAPQATVVLDAVDAPYGIGVLRFAGVGPTATAVVNHALD